MFFFWYMLIELIIELVICLRLLLFLVNNESWKKKEIMKCLIDVISKKKVVFC